MARSSNSAYPHPLVFGNLLLSLTMKSMSCKVSGTSVGAGASAPLFRVPVDLFQLGAGVQARGVRASEQNDIIVDFPTV
jgi:hypothetical protein